MTKTCRKDILYLQNFCFSFRFRLRVKFLFGKSFGYTSFFLRKTLGMDLQEPGFSDSRDPTIIFAASRDTNRVLKTPLKTWVRSYLNNIK